MPMLHYSLRAIWNATKDVELLREHYPFKTNVELVKLLGKSERSISAKAQRLKVKRDWRFRQQILKEAKNRSL